MRREIILKKDIDERYLEGYFITEEEYKKVKRTIIKKVKGDKLLQKVTYLDKIIKNKLIAEEWINSLTMLGYEVIRDKVNQFGKTGFRTINNITGEVEYVFNFKEAK